MISTLRDLFDCQQRKALAGEDEYVHFWWLWRSILSCCVWDFSGINSSTWSESTYCQDKRFASFHFWHPIQYSHTGQYPPSTLGGHWEFEKDLNHLPYQYSDRMCRQTAVDKRDRSGSKCDPSLMNWVYYVGNSTDAEGNGNKRPYPKFNVQDFEKECLEREFFLLELQLSDSNSRLWHGNWDTTESIEK